MKTRRNFLKESAFAATAIAIPNPFKLVTGKGSAFSFFNDDNHSITLLHTNDLHNQLSPVNYGTQNELGGFEKTASVISAIKNKRGNVLLLDAGDISCGNVQQAKEHEKTLRMMQWAGYDAVLLGNRDYQAGTDYLQEQWQKNSIPVISSNYSYFDNRLKNLHLPYKILHKGNFRIGILGAGIHLKGLVDSELDDKVRYKNPVHELSSLATMLKKEKECHLVICLSHLGFKNKGEIDDIRFAAQSKNIDVIIGGHSHTFMQSPHVVLNQQNQEVIINHAGNGGIVLGNIQISFDDYGRKNRVVSNNLMIGTKDNKWVSY